MCAFEEEIVINNFQNIIVFERFAEANLLLSAIVYLSSAVSIVYLVQWKSLRTCMTSFNLNQWDEWFRKVWEIWLLKLPQGGIVLKLLTGNTGGIVMQLNLGWNSKTTVMFKEKKLQKYNKYIYYHWFVFQEWIS